MVKPKLLVTRKWPAAVEARLKTEFDVRLNQSDQAMAASDLRDALKSVDAILPTVTDKLTADVFDMPKCQTRLIANFGVGYSHIDMDRTRSLGISVTNTPDVLSDCTADLALTLMLMAARRAGEGEREVRSGGWTGWRPTHLIGTKMTGKTLGIIGFGRIGQAVAHRAHHGFGMRILVQNRSKLPLETLAATSAEQIETIDELLPQADFVSLHCPGGAQTHHLIDQRRLKLMKPTAFLINTARGEVVDEQALGQALFTNAIGGAGLDVFEGEPDIRPDLLKCSNAVLLPHLGSATSETREAMGFRVLDNVHRFFRGETPPDLVS